MLSLAFKMLIGNRASCIGVIFGVFLATLLIAQQSAIFLGVVARSYRMVTDLPQPTIWVIDPATESEDKVRSLPLKYLDVVRSVPGVEWAVPFNSALIPMVTANGTFDISFLYGIDDASLIGAPNQIVEGSVQDLRREDSIIIDNYAARETLAKLKPDGSKEPLQIGQALEINGKRAVIVGISKVTPSFYPQPIIFTTLSQFKIFNPNIGERINYILVKTKPNEDVKTVAKRIDAYPELHALTSDEFKSKISNFLLKTGIVINFGLSVVLGMIVGFSITGQIFYMMTLENVGYYALIKAVGGTENMILKMIIFQAAIVGIIGYALGIGVTLLWGVAIKDTSLAFLFPWQLFAFTGTIILIICTLTAALSIRKVSHADPKILMGA